MLVKPVVRQTGEVGKVHNFIAVKVRSLAITGLQPVQTEYSQVGPIYTVIVIQIANHEKFITTRIYECTHHTRLTVNVCLVVVIAQRICAIPLHGESGIR